LNEISKRLRENFIFKIIPMLNPDGVIIGNYRCSLVGADLNRRWKNPNKVCHPTIYYAKQLFIKSQKEKPISLFCDFHGHSRHKDCFMYGCSNHKNNKKIISKLFPLVLSKKCKYFRFENCKFGQHPKMERTARISLWRELKINEVYTLECSFCGTQNGNLFSIEMLKQIGIDFCNSIAEYFEIFEEYFKIGKLMITL